MSCGISNDSFVSFAFSVKVISSLADRDGSVSLMVVGMSVLSPHEKNFSDLALFLFDSVSQFLAHSDCPHLSRLVRHVRIWRTEINLDGMEQTLLQVSMSPATTTSLSLRVPLTKWGSSGKGNDHCPKEQSTSLYIICIDLYESTRQEITKLRHTNI